MTRVAFTLPPAPTAPRTRNPAGLTAKATTQNTHGLPCRDQFDASTSVLVTKCASEATPRPREVKGLHTIPRQFERLNAAQMRADRRSDWVNALPPVWFLFVAGGACLFALLVADTIYSAFFDWMVMK